MRTLAGTRDSARKNWNPAPARPELASAARQGVRPVPAVRPPDGAGFSFGRIPVHARSGAGIQPKLKVNTPGDRYEREADRVAEQVVGQRASAEDRLHARPGSRIAPGSGAGKPLDAGVNEEMSRRMGFDFSNVRIHTDDEAGVLNRGLNARAFTRGSDIYFDRGEYSPGSSRGRSLLAHELTHVVQQSGAADGPAPQGLIQRTTVGDVLDEFFSPFSAETLWLMPESDNYTAIVRTWQPVIDAVKLAKTDLETNCTAWSTSHKTDAAWKPGKTDPPVTDPNAFAKWVSSPPGTDPATCKKAFIPYVASKALPMKSIQTFELYTCSIGSFGIYATVDSIDCTAKKATMNIWMYNAMDQGSFGKFASHPAFSASGMERQYMWWNWKETHSWGAPPSAGSGGTGSGGGTTGGGSSGKSKDW